MVRDNPKSPMVLVVENNADVLELVTSFVSVQGWEPVAASGLGEAREVLRTNHVDAIVTDLSLDDGDGLELVRDVHAGTETPVPILVISSYATPEIRDIALQAGAIDLMAKPFRLGRFAEVLGNALGVCSAHTSPIPA